MLQAKSKSKTISTKSKLGLQSKTKTKHNLPTTQFNDMEQQEWYDVKSVKKMESFKQFDGSGCLSKKQQLDIIPLKCDDSVQQLQSQLGIIDIEQEKPNVWPNQGSVLIKCPPKCGGIGTQTQGINIHPWNAPICISAEVDRAVSVQGGIARLTLAPGLDFYENGTGQILNVKIKRHDESKLSFITSAVDNVDSVFMNIRFMDASNQPNSQGRVEIRWFDSWHALCGKGDNLLTAKMMCMNAGQLSGFQMYPLRSPDDATNTGCGAYCGSDSINRIQLICPPTAMMFDECDVVNFVVCDSFNDFVVKCLEEELGPDEPDFKRAFIKVGTNRYIPQFQYGGKKAIPCMNALKEKEAMAMCRAEGHAGGGKVSMLWASESKPNASKASNEFAQQVSCPSSERLFSNKCGMASVGKEKTCDDLQEVIECFGDKTPTEDYFAPYVPVMRAPLPEAVQATCDTDAMELPGDPGSKQVVRCPADCQDTAAKMEGSGVYSLDSSVCKAAIHTGVSQPGKERVINVTIGYPMKKLTSTLHYEVQSQASENVYKTFKVSETDSCSLFQTELMRVFLKDAKERRFIQLSSRIRSRTQVAEEASNLVKEWWLANFNSIEKQFKPSFHQVRMGDDIVNLDGTNQLSLAEDKGATVFKKNLPFEFSFAFGMKLPQCPFENDMTILTNGNNGFFIGIKKAVGLEKCRIQFQNYITEIDSQKFDTEFRPQQSQEFTNQAFVQSHGQMQFYVDGKEQLQKNNLRFNEFGNGEDPVHIGADSTSKSNKLNGAISQIVQFEEAISADLVLKMARDGVTEFPQSSSSSGEQTVDGRSCIASCKGGRPGQQDDGIPDAHAGLNGLENMFKKKRRKDIGDLLLGKEDAQIAEEQAALDTQNAHGDKENQRNAAICQVTFKLLLSVQPFKVGQNAMVACPKHCLSHTKNVFGPTPNPDKAIYAAESSICIAAIHSSILEDDNGGDIEVIHAGEHTDYQSMQKNNIMSKSIQRSIGFQVKFTSAPNKLNQQTTFEDIQDGASNQLVVKCPLGIYKDQFLEWQKKEEQQTKIKKQFVQGSQLQGGRGYAKQTRVCYSALHAGILGNNTGSYLTLKVHKYNYTVSFTCDADKDCDVNGVKSGAVVGQIGQTIHSSLNSCGYKKAVFQQNYELLNDFQVINKGEQAVQTIDRILNGDQHGLKALKIPLINKLESQMLLKNFECPTYTFAISFRIDNQFFSGALSILLAYHEINDKSNQYEIRIEKKFVQFFIKTDNSETMLAKTKYDDKLEAQKHQIIKINIINQTYTGQLYVLGQLEPKKLFEVKDNTQERGSVGFGFRKTTDISIYEIDVTPVNEKLIKNTQNDNFCTRSKHNSVRIKFCKEYRCDVSNSVFQFCKMCCNKMIHVNNIYQCTRNCLENQRIS